MATMVAGEYALVGKPAALGLAIDESQAELLRETTEWEFFPEVDAKYRAGTHASLGGVSFGPSPELGVGSEDCLYVGARTVYTPDNSWFLDILVSHYRFDGTQNHKSSHYKVSMIAGRLMEAFKQVRVIRDLSSLTIEAAFAEQPLEVKKLAYERPLNQDDVDVLQLRMIRAARRANAMGKKRTA